MLHTTITRRAGDGSDDAGLGQLMFDAIHNGPSLYTKAERAAWLRAPNHGPDWSRRVAMLDVVVARQDQQMVGMLCQKEDYIDLAFIAPHMQGKGVFRALYEVLERDAKAKGLARLWTHASLMAQPAFLALGFCVIRHETIAQKGEFLRRAEMEKRLR